jgi:hypothetical protein
MPVTCKEQRKLTWKFYDGEMSSERGFLREVRNNQHLPMEN